MIDQLLKYGHISVNAMAKQLYVSPATVRRDLKTLEADGLVHRTHGGAVHVAQVSDKLARFYRDREITCLEEKRVIGRAAADLARDGETVALASGSTTAQVALNLTQWRRLTVITNDLSHVRALSEFDQVSVFVPGGFVRLGRDNLIGPNSIPSVRDFRDRSPVSERDRRPPPTRSQRWTHPQRHVSARTGGGRQILHSRSRSHQV
ncbi:MAG: DeoR/GlpR transcriptional regulator [Chloroflexi bacterium]|nr:DeoR/GlpR transcriptional regulator [Chloroflexota bacterium]